MGDHIYGDILRSKKTLGWRTMLVVPELETELEVQAAHAGVMRELKALRQQVRVCQGDEVFVQIEFRHHQVWWCLS